MTIFGIDISHWQGKLDFKKLLAAGVRFVIAKAGEIPLSSKKEFLDDLYQRNIREATENDITSGAYHFFHPSIGASRQARHFYNVMKTYGWPDLPPVIDVEVTDGMQPIGASAVLKSMIDQLAELGIYEIIIYTRNGLWVNQYANPDWATGYEYTDKAGEKHQVKIWFWMAQYPKLTNREPKIRDQIIMHQYTDKGRLTGIGVNLDIDNWLKSEADLMKMAGLEFELETSAEPAVQSAHYKRSLAFISARRTEDGLWQRLRNR